jgi:hypothetical protein
VENSAYHGSAAPPGFQVLGVQSLCVGRKAARSLDRGPMAKTTKTNEKGVRRTPSGKNEVAITRSMLGCQVGAFGGRGFPTDFPVVGFALGRFACDTRRHARSSRADQAVRGRQ